MSLIAVLSQMNPIYILPVYFFKILCHYLPFILRCLNDIFHSDFVCKNVVFFAHQSYTCYMPHPPHPLHMVILIIYVEDCRL